MIKKKNINIFAIISLLLLGACSVKVVVPDVVYPEYEELRAGAPDCNPALDQMEKAPTEDNALDALFCFQNQRDYWIGQWLLLDAQIKSIQKE